VLVTKELGGRNKLAKLLDFSGPYIRRVLSVEKPITAEVVQSIRLFNIG
jgi:hypothetical protein